jgi:P-type Cu2+ transporter
MQDQSQGIAYEIVHRTKGRIRIRIPELKTDLAYAHRLEQLIAVYASQTGSQIYTRINLAATSIIVTYEPRVLSEKVILHQLREIIQQAGDINPGSALFPETLQHFH